jgi:iron complex outermembrane receptor protein
VGQLANPDLQPEQIRTYEAVWEQDFGSRRRASLSYFQNRIKNLISQSVVAGGRQFLNQERVRTEGAELHGKAELTRTWSGHAGYILQSTRVQGGDRLSNSPTHVANLGLSRRLAWWDADVAFDSFLVSARITNDGGHLPTTGLMSLHARLWPLQNRLSVYGGVHNVFDTDHRVSGSSEHVQSAIPQDGRNFNLGLEYRFGGRSS